MAVLLFLGAGMSIAQAQAQSGAQAGAAGSTNAQQYTDAALHVTFWYPEELTAQDARAIAGVGHPVTFGEEDDSGPRKADTCSRVLLAVGRPARTPGSGAAADMLASISLVDTDPSCVPPPAEKDRKKMDKVLGELTRSATMIFGMMPIEQPLGYEIDGNHVHFAAAQGQPVTKTDLQTADAEYIGAVAVAVQGHILRWTLQATDLDLFNRLLASRVDFGSGKPQALAPQQFAP